MNSRCEHQGQVEGGVIGHEGRTFAALGASVQGRNVTGYQKTKNGEVTLTTWSGEITLACRSEVVEEFHDGALVLLFRLTKGRFVVGYSLGQEMLFRGELLSDCDDDEARRMARQIAHHFAELDAFDEYMASQHEDEAA